MTRASPIPERAWPRDGALRAWLAARSGGARLHAGVDLGWRGDVVRAPEGGIVDVIGRASYGADTPRTSTPIGWAGYGPFLVVLHGDSGWYHLLAHVVDPSVTLGQRVELGRAIARVSERGDHLHWEVRTRRKPPSGWATVEVTDDPAAWLELERPPGAAPLRRPAPPGGPAGPPPPPPAAGEGGGGDDDSGAGWLLAGLAAAVFVFFDRE